MAVISCVIPMRPTREEEQGAYLTAAAAHTQLEKLGQQFEIIFAVDFGPTGEANNVGVGDISNGGAIYVRHGSPQGARHEAITKAKGSKVFCLDAHVICSQGFFEDALNSMAKINNMAMIAAPLVFRNRHSPAYGYAVGYQTDFWNMGYHNRPVMTPDSGSYPVGSAGHGAMLFNRDIYMTTGGYSLEQKGWGGEETFLNLKFWMLGYECHMLPKHYQWHYMTPNRNAGRTHTEEFAFNFCFAAYAIGGTPGMLPVLEYFKRRHPGLQNRVREIEQKAKQERERIERGPFKGSLPALLAHFKAKGIPA